MVTVGKAVMTGGGRQLGAILVLQGVIQAVLIFLSSVMGAAVRNDDDGGEYPCGIFTPVHVEAVNTEVQQVMGDTSGR